MKQKGFTLLEIITSLAVVSILFTSGSSGYNFLITQNRVQGDIGNLLTMLRSTRLQAISNTTISVLCPSLDEINCTRDWKLPLIQFNDTNKNKKRDSSEVIQKRFGAFIGEDLLINYPKTQVRFDENGMANFYNGTFSYCLPGIIKGIVISRIGRIRFAQDLNGDHIPDIDSNTPVSCS